MKKKLSFSEYIYVASMLFGLFFGAGNLIFPVHMGQLAGKAVIPAIIGFCVTGVGLPLLGVAALGSSRSNGLYDLGLKVNKTFSLLFTCALYLTIGPFFAIPRCATTSFTVGISHILPSGSNETLFLLIFSTIFFALALYFSLFPGKILTYVGKILNPCFLLFLAILVIVALLNPSISVKDVPVDIQYQQNSFFKGFLEGYNTMDALASLAFGIVVVTVIKGLGVNDSDDVAKNTILSGIFSCALMALIYFATTIVGTQSRGLFETSENGGIALAEIAHHYLGGAGFIILALTVTLACLKTSIGLITSCSETFSSLFKKGPSYKAWVVILSFFSFAISNVGLNSIISLSLPVLMFLYPIAITLILLALFDKFFKGNKLVYNCVIGLTLFSSLHDFLFALPSSIKDTKVISLIITFLGRILPLSDLGLSWIAPAILGLVISLPIVLIKGKLEE